MDELVGDVAQDGCAAWRDAAFGNEGEETDEELAEVDGPGELGELGEKVGGEVFRITVRLFGCAGLSQTEVVRTKSQVGLRAR